MVTAAGIISEERARLALMDGTKRARPVMVSLVCECRHPPLAIYSVKSWVHQLDGRAAAQWTESGRGGGTGTRWEWRVRCRVVQSGNRLCRSGSSGVAALTADPSAIGHAPPCRGTSGKKGVLAALILGTTASALRLDLVWCFPRLAPIASRQIPPPPRAATLSGFVWASLADRCR